jgi:hypothetical protein
MTNHQRKLTPKEFVKFAHMKVEKSARSSYLASSPDTEELTTLVFYCINELLKQNPEYLERKYKEWINSKQAKLYKQALDKIQEDINDG